jgi:hypothetical protein
MLASYIAPAALRADTVILRNGSSYTGQYTAAPGGMVSFTDAMGIKYKFPAHDVQTIVFTNTNDTLTLRDGHSYTGQVAGLTTVQFSDAQGIQYQFPIADVSSLVLSQSAMPIAKLPATLKEIPYDTEITVRTEENIDSQTASPGQTYRAEIAENVLDSSGAIAIPKGSSAQLQISKISSGGLLHTPELALDLASVTLHGKTYTVVTSDEYENGKEGVGANKRTAGFMGGGAALGTLMGSIFGGGKGALIGALAGAGTGGATQVLTRGKHVSVPAEAVLMFHLEKTLILQPK